MSSPSSKKTTKPAKSKKAITELNSAQRRKLKQQAHHLKPLIRIGSKGVNESVFEQVTQALVDHELIKIKFLEYKDAKTELVPQIVQACQALLVDTIGHIAIIYKAHEKPEKRKIQLGK